jgi:hypothetical protein
MTNEELRNALAAEKTEYDIAQEIGCTVHELRKSVCLQLLVTQPKVYREMAGAKPAKPASK